MSESITCEDCGREFRDDGAFKEHYGREHPTEFDRPAQFDLGTGSYTFPLLDLAVSDCGMTVENASAWVHGFSLALRLRLLNSRAFRDLAEAYVMAEDADPNIGPPPKDWIDGLANRLPKLARGTQVGRVYR